ncbi:electron transport complex subunit E [Oscillospiraceae bacterium NSJ-64]|uniref:Ion-translocating oxidoreductase complex subunit E n=2 Tax=Youxingia wuxianensis TaxID=2763678 RepID=A0A926ES05_9FIRM|nr:electron transport complex subunit E [Youxingia wuxianensis]MBC8585547.1 electron transport complex subunit E [Youxingia wuxianensis]
MSKNGTQKMSNLSILLNGIIKENPVMVLLLGTCPSLAVTTMASNAIGMGLATTFVLIGSNVVISLIKNVIPKTVRIPCYIVVIAGFVTIIKQLMMAYVQPLYVALGVFLDLIVVNCILLGRAEVFASKNTVGASFFDGLGMGLGFTLSLLAISSVRELLGAGTWMGITVTANLFDPIGFFTTPAGGFFVFGILIALVGILLRKQGKTPRKSFGCGSCPAAGTCQNRQEGC